MLLPVRLSSVMLVHTPQAVVIFSNFSTACGALAIHWHAQKILQRLSPPLGELNPRGVAKYSDFGPIKGYISETVSFLLVPKSVTLNDPERRYFSEIGSIRRALRISG